MDREAPRVSFGVPVRNGAATLARCLDSILAQDFRDFEVIVSDNASTDETCQVAAAFALRDPRIRLVRQETNVGLIENFNRVAREARGEFFRWVGADDWLEADCTSACVAALEAHPEAIAATTGFDLATPVGSPIARDCAGEYLESPSPRRRLARLLWFYHAGLGVYEPNYSLIRRKTLLETGLLRIHRQCDWLFSTGLCLKGPLTHVPKIHLHRGWTNLDRAALAGLARRLHPVPQPALERSLVRLYLGLARVVADADLSTADRLACQRLILQFCLRDGGRRLFKSLSHLRRSVGITRERFERLSGSSRTR